MTETDRNDIVILSNGKKKNSVEARYLSVNIWIYMEVDDMC
ncbi:hypothetical protein CLOL250_00643 [Clostridium sp. L2-50]|nr:hypothetical protein CLOL250_00643 [Clostridium sp. L2-50]